MTRADRETRYIADQGIEAALLAAEGDVRPCAAAFPLIEEPGGVAWLKAHYRSQASAAARHGLGFLFETPTWRASSDWGEALGYTEADLHRINVAAVELCREMAAQHPHMASKVVGQVGPRNCSYVPAERMSADEAAIYHRTQIRAFREAGADAVAALGINDVDEAVGVVIAARCSGLPCTVTFSVDARGRLPSGLPLAAAIAEVDERTRDAAAHFGVICAKPLPVLGSLPRDLMGRVKSLRLNHNPFGSNGYEIAQPPHASSLAADLSAVAFVSSAITDCGGPCGCAALPQSWPSRLPSALIDCLNVAPVLH